MGKTGLALAAGLMFSIAANAQRAPVTIGEVVVVTATRIPQKLSQSNQHVTVITAEDIAAGGYQSLPELLQSRGGVEVTNTGGLGQPSAVFMRGAEARHTLVLVNGLRIGSATAGSTPFETIPLNQIERIEIVPGPLSSVYGQDAIGGVIQIFTRSGTAGGSAQLEAGSYGTRGLSGAYGRRVNDTEFSLSAGVLASRGFDSSKPARPFGQHNPDADGYRNQNFSGQLAQHIGGGNELGVTGFYSKGRADFDAGLATNDLNRQMQYTVAAYSRNPITRNWNSLVRIGTSRDYSLNEGAFPGYFQTDQDQFTWQNDVRTFIGTLAGGLEYLDQRISSDTVYKQTSRDVKSIFAGYRGEYRSHALQVNARRDDNSQFGGHNTGSLGYSYRFDSGLRFRASAGTAFKAPTFNDLYFPDDPFSASNPNLRPERSRSREAGLDYAWARGQIGATLFQTHIGDLITIVVDPVTFLSTTENLNSVVIEGLELVWRGELGGWQTRAQATFQDPRNEITGAQLRRRAGQYGALGAERKFGPWRFGGELVGSGARFDSTTEAQNTRMHGYGLVNLTGGYAWSREWSVNTRWNNVFDRDYELVQFFNTPGSNVFVWLVWQPR